MPSPNMARSWPRNILNSPRAVAMSVYVIRAFVKMREDLAANAAILKRLAEIDKTLLMHDDALREIFQKLRPLLEPSPQPPRPENRFPYQGRCHPLPHQKTNRPPMTTYAPGTGRKAGHVATDPFS